MCILSCVLIVVISTGQGLAVSSQEDVGAAEAAGELRVGVHIHSESTAGQVARSASQPSALL